MSLTNDQITAQNFKDYHNAILPYLNGGRFHSGFTPIGTIISVMGTQAPQNYLACNGQTVNIADYPELANYFNAQFGASNFFGGNGTTTFGIPDLRGEFLRGTGTNSHTNQGDGASVGVHQDGTTHPGIYQYGDNILGIYVNGSSSGFNFLPQNTDTDATHTHYLDYTKNITTDTGEGGTYTSRPTNTSVLYCIATKNFVMDASCHYSTDEQVVGTWIDGKPVYQKVYTGLSLAFNNEECRVILPDINPQVIISAIAIDTVYPGIKYCSCDTTSTPNQYRLIASGADATYSTLIIAYTKTTD